MTNYEMVKALDDLSKRSLSPTVAILAKLLRKEIVERLPSSRGVVSSCTCEDCDDIVAGRRR